MDGAVDFPARRADCGAAMFSAGAGATSLGLLENMTACLDEGAGIAGFVGEPDFVMDMRAGGTAGGPHPSQDGALVDLRAHFHADRGQMAITGVDAEAVIHFHHIAIAATITGEYDGPRRGGGDPRPPGTGEIDAGVKRILPGEGIDTRAEAAAAVERNRIHRRGQGNMADFA